MKIDTKEMLESLKKLAQIGFDEVNKRLERMIEEWETEIEYYDDDDYDLIEGEGG